MVAMMLPIRERVMEMPARNRELIHEVPIELDCQGEFCVLTELILGIGILELGIGVQ